MIQSVNSEQSKEDRSDSIIDSDTAQFLIQDEL